MIGPESEALWQRAKAAIAGGVNSPARSFRPMGGEAPLFVAAAEGGHFIDADGRRYIEFLAAFGPNVIGHGHPKVLAALERQMREGLLFGAPCRGEVEFAERLCAAVPEMEQVRLVSSGTEAVMSAIRLARAATGRRVIVKFDGNYHGHADTVLVRAGSGATTTGGGGSEGVTEGVRQDVRSLPFNDLAAFERLIAEEGSDVAAVLIEPISGNMGVVEPEPGYLAGVSRLAHSCGALVIDDEIIVGFRLRFGIIGPTVGLTPDIVCLGKAIGGGLAMGAYGARRDLMRLIAPLGPMFQAGTLAGNPFSVAAGQASLDVLSQPGVYEQLEAAGAELSGGVLAAGLRYGVNVSIRRVGSMFTLFFRDPPPRNYLEAKAHDGEAFRRFFWEMLRRGIYLAPSPYEAWFVTLGHTPEDIRAAITAAEESFGVLRALDSQAKDA
ncbi:MAG: glutamate-1-semialdehyde 2,1-aminomutase [Thermaerobacter sp.]|nr:glutamate-1-semialdehyde 2,1-aminomutase [Thermaerobacter sp.]